MTNPSTPPSDGDFWKGRRVLVTGHTGFKGGWLSLWLKSMGAETTGLALEPEEEGVFVQARAHEGIDSVIGDIRDPDVPREVVERANPEVVIHMAAQALVHEAYADPLTTYATNVMGTANVLDACRDRADLKAVLVVTSDKCYYNTESLWGYRENERLGGFDPYSASKAAAELVVDSYRSSYFGDGGTAVASARAGNVIGGGDWSKDRLVPDIMRAIREGEPVKIRSPHALRPWQHVLEPLSGYLMIARALVEDPERAVGAWNVGPDIDEIRPVQWIVEYLTKAWGDGASWRLDGTVFPHETSFLRLDCTKIRSLMGWRPALPLAETLDWIVEWYRADVEGRDMRDATMAQIERYREMQSIRAEDRP